MPDAIQPEEVERIALLARLALTDEEKGTYAAQLARILEYARQIEQLSTEGVRPMARPDEDEVATDTPPAASTEQSALERADEARPSLSREDALANAPASIAGLFIVPRAVGSDTTCS
jgi:aspartyl-tRNA(Asn)/glutamyl-tRNA(Gln) amidotransferase subunit C